jgi:predicted exporter
MPSKTTTGQARLLVLHALRLSGFLAVDRIVLRTGVPEPEVAEVLAVAARADEAKQRTGRMSGWMLTPAGREAHATLVGEEFAASGQQTAIEALDTRFVALNEPFKELCTRWQLKGGVGSSTPNDHGDPDYDGEVIAALVAAHDQVRTLCAELAETLPRFGRYGRDFDSALARLKGGDLKAFAAPMSDSYHDVWMELHQDFMSTLGRERSATDGH